MEAGLAIGKNLVAAQKPLKSGAAEHTQEVCEVNGTMATGVPDR